MQLATAFVVNSGPTEPESLPFPPTTSPAPRCFWGGKGNLVDSCGSSAAIDVSPIETRYRGYLTRSRLEARWMRFFDFMGIAFEYEPEGWVLQDGTRYLPDFLLPQIKAWAEVKPIPFTAAERHKCESLVGGTGGLILLLPGPPSFRAYEGISRDCGFLTRTTYSLDIWEYLGRYYHEEHRLFCQPERLSEAACSERYRVSIYESRSARFDGKDLPAPGMEPFNADPEDVRKAWEL